MLNIVNESNNPYYNLALEEYALKNLDPDEDYIILWQNKPTVVVGRNQNTIEEINNKYVKENDINIVRRLSGGGAVYHDFGNLNFTFITKANDESINNFKKFTKPVIETLNNLGIQAKFSGRNDITIDEKKISGNAQYYYKEKMLHHGTILFNSELSVVSDVLNVKLDKIQSKGIKSVKSRVSNIYPYLDKKISIDEFKNILIKHFLNTNNINTKNYILTKSDKNNIKKLMKKRYLTWNWTFGKSPNFNIKKYKRYPGGNLDIRLDVKKGIIKECNIYGDFFGEKAIELLENYLTNNKYEELTIKKVLNSLNLNKFFYNITKKDFIDCMFY